MGGGLMGVCQLGESQMDASEPQWDLKKDANHENYDAGDDEDMKGKGEDEDDLKTMQLEKGAGTVTWTFLNAVAYSSYVDCLL